MDFTKDAPGQLETCLDLASSKSEQDLYIYAMFPQLFSSTACGLSDIDGQALTTAYVVVIKEGNPNDPFKGRYFVFFNKILAYTLENPTPSFFTDLAQHKMKYQHDYEKHYLHVQTFGL